MDIVKPPRLLKGDLIGLIAPASTPSAPEKIEKGVRYLEQLGYRVKVGNHVLDQLGYLAGTDKDRADDLNAMLKDKQVKAIFTIRGGYGTPRILSLVDYRAARRNPKILVGYSDITALQLALLKTTGLVTFSGPMSGVEMWNSIDPYTEEHFWRVVTSPSKVGFLQNPDNEALSADRKGKATGRLLGGNLSLLISNLATPYSPDYRRAILVLEEVDEAPHRVDRMLTQLLNAGILRSIRALLLGRFTDCVPSDSTKPHLTVEQVLAGVKQALKVPVLSNLQYGHIPKKLTLPLGLRTQVDAKKGTIEIPEAAVT